MSIITELYDEYSDAQEDAYKYRQEALQNLNVRVSLAEIYAILSVGAEIRAARVAERIKRFEEGES